MNLRRFAGHVVVFCVSIALLLSFVPVSTRADVKRKVTIHVGAPAVWSMGQAHYLLAQIQKRNRALDTNMPKPDELDPNGTNATRIQILRTLLDIGAEYSQKVGTENKAALDNFKDKKKRRDEAREEYKKKKAELDALNKEIGDLNEKLARKQEEYNQKKAAREAPRKNPDPPPDTLETPLPDDAENNLKIDIEVLKKRIDARTADQTKLKTDVDALKAEADKDVALTGLAEVEPPNTGAASLPQMSSFISDHIKRTADTMGQPRFAASIALDNFIGMQYEILAKQLTLLRDEVGPDNRVVFLELPSSIYTAACDGDDYIAQVQWKVSGYTTFETQGQRCVESEDDKNNLARGIRTLDCPQPTSVDHLVDKNQVRALDIIPRQSALNVNDVQSTTSQKNFLGVMKLLVGLGVKVNYQRQRELYEQYLQQEVFASGFGKGMNVFGWTFGPLPGTHRIAPGVRTTYAVLSVPRYTTRLTFEATGVAFHRNEAPEYVGVDNSSFKSNGKQVAFGPIPYNLDIPGEYTEKFYVDSMYYTPARKGQPVTVIVRGDAFSSQMGVVVDGKALTKVISLGNTATSDALQDPDGTGIRGQYELVSSRELVMKIYMGDNYVGTPNITLVTPERASALNFINLLVNGHRPNTSLRDLVQTEPMFIPEFSLENQLTGVVNEGNYRKARLKGVGLRRRAEIWINGVKLALRRENWFAQVYAQEESTGEYSLRFPKDPNGNAEAETYEVRYRQNAIHGLDSGEFTYKRILKAKEKAYSLMHYAPNAKTAKATLDVRFKSDTEVKCAKVSPASQGTLVGKITKEGDNQYRGVFSIDYDNLGSTRVEKESVSISLFNEECKAAGSATPFATRDIPIAVHPQVSKATLSVMIKDGEETQVLTFDGINLQNILKVTVGDKEAEIIGSPDHGVLVVRMPKGTSIKDDAAVQVPVVLTTKDGTQVSVVATVGNSKPAAKPKAKKSTKKSKSANATTEN